jgi:hypothetical protein
MGTNPFRKKVEISEERRAAMAAQFARARGEAAR